MSYWLSRWWLLEWLIREVREIERVTHWPEGRVCEWGGEVKESDREGVMRMRRGSKECISSGKSVENKAPFCKGLCCASSLLTGRFSWNVLFFLVTDQNNSKYLYLGIILSIKSFLPLAKMVGRQLLLHKTIFVMIFGWTFLFQVNPTPESSEHGSSSVLLRTNSTPVTFLEYLELVKG